MESNQNLNELFSKFLDKKCSREELQQLFAYFHTSDESVLRTLIESELHSADNDSELVSDAEAEHLGRVHQEIKSKLRTDKKSIGLPYRFISYAAAAVLLLIVGVGIYIHKTDSKLTEDTQLTSQYGHDVLPGKDQATITLANGETIVLSDGKDGIITDGTTIRY